MTVTTTDGSVFTKLESVAMARLVFKRFGHNLSDATDAWRRLLQNDCTESDFMDLVEYPTHTEHCEGDCTAKR